MRAWFYAFPALRLNSMPRGRLAGRIGVYRTGHQVTVGLLAFQVTVRDRALYVGRFGFVPARLVWRWAR